MTDGVIVIVSDLHVGGSTALMPPKYTTADGQTIKASKAQAWLWDCWLDFCAVVKSYSRGESKALVILNGDLIEGCHHEVSQVLTTDETSHADLAIEVLDPLMRHASACAFVKGTPAHDGKSARFEQLVANNYRNCGLVMDGKNLMHDILRCTYAGVKLNIAHHVRGGSEYRLRLSSLLALVQRHTMDAHRFGTPVADFVIRSHVHHYTFTGDIFKAKGITVPCWQLPTDFVHKVSPDSLPDIGGVIIHNGEVVPVIYPVLLSNRSYPVIKVNNGKKNKTI